MEALYADYERRTGDELAACRDFVEALAWYGRFQSWWLSPSEK